MRQRLGKTGNLTDTLSNPPQLLQAIHRHSPPPTLPDTGLALPWLFTAGKGSPSLLAELRRELAACDQVDILVSFITHSGVRKLLDILQSVTAMGANGQRKTRFRILTTTARRTPFQAGVLALQDRKVELLFVTLDKLEGYHERIAYHDYAISTECFHWQSQNSAGPETMAGRRYLESLANGWGFQLFVRRNKGNPYRACGPVMLENWEGEKPISIIWRLSVPLPIRLFQEYSILRGS